MLKSSSLFTGAAMFALALTAGMLPREARAVNEVAEACQLPGAYLTETGLERLVRTGVLNMATAFFNPVDDFTTRQKKKMKKAAAMLGGGVAAMTLCPPLVVPEGFREDWTKQQRLDFALDKDWDLTGISPMDFEVDNPADPQSCRRTLTTTINAGGQMTDGGDFTELEFVYVEPFGTFPSAVGQYEEVIERIRKQVEALLSRFLISIEPFEAAIAGLEDFTDLIDGFLSDLGLNPDLSFFIPDIEVWLLEMIGLGLAPNCDSVDLECEFRRDFDFWGTNLPDLVAEGTVQRPGGGSSFLFPDGPSAVAFNSDINTGFSTEIRYTQDIFVKEFFPPTFDVVAVESDPDGGPDLNVIADFTFEALEPGRAVTTFTPPSAVIGQIAVDDNCDPDPDLVGGIPTELPLGVHYLPVSAEDRTFNVVGRPGQDPLCPIAADPNNPSDNPACEKYAIKVTVTDTRPPDILPPDPIGIPVAQSGGVVGFTDTDIGCIEFNCQQVRTDVNLFPPPLFDFASDATNVGVQCEVTNSLATAEPCATAQLPVGETSTVEWTMLDSSGNSSVVTQLAAVRESGTNQSPIALGTVVEVAANTTAPIELRAGDPEFDPIQFDVRSLPVNGTLNVDPDPILQTRVSLTGTLTDLTDAVHVRGQLDNNRFADVLADPVGRRLLAVNDIKVIDALYFDTIRPDSISLRESDFVVDDNVFNQPGGTPSALTANLLVGDWTQRRIYGLVDNPAGSGPVVIPDAGLALPAVIENPAHFEMIGNRLFITDPDSVDPTQGRIHVLELGNVSVGTTPAQWTLASTTSTTLGFNATGITLPAPISGCPVFSSTTTLMLGDWNQSSVHLVSVSGSNAVTSEFEWDIGDFTADPGGEARPDLGSPQDLALLTDDCRETTSDPFRLVVIDDANKNFEGLTLTTSTPAPSATPEVEQSLTSEFSRLFGVEALTDTEFMTLEKGRIARFDLFGNLLSNLQTTPQDSTGVLDGDFDSNRLIPLDSSSWAAMTTDGNGNAFALSFGSSSTQITNQVTKFQIFDGHNNVNVIATQDSNVTGENSNERGRSVAYSPGQMSAITDDVVYALTDNGLERFDADLSGSEILFSQLDPPCLGSWCAVRNAEFPVLDMLDVVADEMGNVYLSDLENDRVHKFAHDGSYFGWLGRCDSGIDCDVANGRSIGFSCTAATCGASVKSGTAEGQFDFVDEPVDQDKPRVSSAMLHVALDAGQIYVTDNPDFGAGPVPRVQIFSLAGDFISATVPNEDPGDILDFLDVGEFNTINDLSTTADRLFIIEDLPLTRLHIFDVNPFTATVDGAVVQYTPNAGFTGSDNFTYTVTDSFGAESLQAIADITVIPDDEDPVISFCPAPVTVEVSEEGGARAWTGEPGNTGNVELADWLDSVEFSDNVQVPGPTLNIQTSNFLNQDFFPVNLTTQVQFAVFDSSGNFTTCLSSVTVEDTIPPQVVCPADIEVEATGPLTPVEVPDPEVLDTGGATVTRTGGRPGGYPPRRRRAGPSGGVISEVRDFGDNAVFCTTNIFVADSTPPEIQPPAVRGVAGPQAAVNGHSNPYSIPAPVGSDSVGLDGPVACQPALTGTAAAVPLEFVCVARDLGGNVGRVEFTYEIEQLNGDGDVFADVVDPTPGVADDSAVFSDGPLGGSTSGTYTPGTAGEFGIMDAWLPEQGVRAEWISDSPSNALNNAVVSACGDTLRVTDFGIKLDELGDVDISAVSITCGPSAVRNHLGAISAIWTLPNDFEATAGLPESAGLAIGGFMATADTDNEIPVQIQVAENTVEVAPGQTVDLQSFANFRPTAGAVPDFELIEDTVTTGQLDLGGVFDDEEDGVAGLDFEAVTDSGAGLLSSFTLNGNLLSFEAAPDAFGTVAVTTSAMDTGGLSASTSFNIVIASVNDAPMLSLQGDVFATDLAGPQSLPGFASATPGPANEADQSVDILVTGVSDPILFDIQPFIDGTGALSFTPRSGADGIAVVDVLAMDDGGTANGGVDVTQASFELAVTRADRADIVADLGVDDPFVDPQQVVTYVLKVENAGPEDASGVLIESLVPTGLSNASWSCAAAGGSCGSSSGSGDIFDEVSIAAAGSVTYTLTATVSALEGAIIVSAAAAMPPPDPVDPSLSNNEVELIIQVALFNDEFESAPNP